MLAAQLTNRTGQIWRSINASRPGTNTTHHEKYLKTMLAYAPDVVALLYVFNDIEYLGDSEPPALVERQPFRTIARNSYFVDFLFMRSRLIYYRAIGFQGAGFGYNDVSQTRYANTSLRQRHLQDLKRFVATAQRHGAVAVVVPFDPDVKLPEVYSARYVPFITAARHAGIPVIDTSSAFGPYSYRQLILNRLDRHPSALANSVLATAVAARLGPATEGRRPSINRPIAKVQ